MEAQQIDTVYIADCDLQHALTQIIKSTTNIVFRSDINTVILVYFTSSTVQLLLLQCHSLLTYVNVMIEPYYY